MSALFYQKEQPSKKNKPVARRDGVRISPGLVSNLVLQSFFTDGCNRCDAARKSTMDDGRERSAVWAAKQPRDTIHRPAMAPGSCRTDVPVPRATVVRASASRIDR
jgi:hypothetical protein